MGIQFKREALMLLLIFSPKPDINLSICKLLNIFKKKLSGGISRDLPTQYLCFTVARYSFSGSIPAKFEHKLPRQKQSFGKIATTVVLNKDETLF